ncbi:MAG: phosphopyruvate hydratase, partial [Elusimicrobia bacterium]|nr:phosphopyruvate hydratase [Elusimicrobiota bacterium]
MKIAGLSASEILDSRGVPTLEATVVLDDGTRGRAAVPSGASTGEHEAVELRDGDKRRFFGKGCLKARSHVDNELARALKGCDASEQGKIDERMIALDGTENKGRLGANAILAVSLAVARSAAAASKQPLYRWLRRAFGLPEKDWLLPTPMFNVVNGGKHADSGLDVQEFMIVPTGAESFSEALRAGCETYHLLKKELSAGRLSTAVGDEGGFAPHLGSHEEALRLLRKAVAAAGYSQSVRLALDAASSEFFHDGAYRFEGKPLSADQLGEVYASWVKSYGLVSLEDPLAEDDWAGWKRLSSALGSSVRLIGD